MSPPNWTLLLREEDEWIVRTALANVAHDLENVADLPGTGNQIQSHLRLSAGRYREVLGRIEMGDVAQDLIG